MTITAKVVAHSACENLLTPEIVTLQLRYARFIHAEFMTHRLFSRNASSSRAVPIERMIQDVIDDPAMPVAWGSNKPGMQAGAEIAPCQINGVKEVWLEARDNAVDSARGLASSGLHKQIVNRILEPFAHISVIVTATEWSNFFELRCHEAADPTMRALAEAVRDAIRASKPRLLQPDELHVPYVTDDERAAFHSKIAAMISAARCARVSYLNHDGSQPDHQKDIDLAERLLASKHMSPFEHQARPALWGTSLNGNLGSGWKQFRRALETQNQF